MTEHPIVGRPLWRGWGALIHLLREPCTAMSIITGSVGAVLVLVPVNEAWLNSTFAETLASAAILDWAKGLLGLLLMLRRLRGGSHGD